MMPEKCLQIGAGVKVVGKKGGKRTTELFIIELFVRLGTCDF